MRSPAALLSVVLCLLCEAQPTAAPLRSDISVSRYMTVRSSAVRLAVDPIDQRLYYLRTTGDVLAVIDNGIALPHDSVVYTAADHGLSEAFGMTFHDSDLYVIGNRITGNTTEGMLYRAHRRPDGTRTWSVAARTGTYAWGGKGHGFNNVVVSPDGEHLFLNCGSRTDHGEVQDVQGAFPGLREEPITCKILRIPITADDLLLPNEEGALAASGLVFAEGFRNTFDMAFDAEERLFGVENSGDHDDPEEMNWLQEGAHYGFPWTAGGNPNPTRLAGYDPATDPLLNPGYPSAATDFHYDPTFPPEPGTFTQPLRNTGPDADRVRDPLTGGMRDASEDGSVIRTFTCHRSPLGLIFDTDSLLGSDLQGDGFTLSFTPGGDTLGFSPIAPWGIPVVPADPSGDLLQLVLTPDGADGFSVSATRIVEGFYLPVDAHQVGNVIHVLENSGGNERAIWNVTLPQATGVDDGADAPGNTLSLWPVPATDRLAWNTGSERAIALAVIDLQGRVVLQERPAATSGSVALDGLPNGTYIVRASFQRGSLHQRFTVAR